MRTEKKGTEYLTSREVAEILRIHPRSVTRFIKEGRLGAVKVGKFWRIPREQLDAFIKRGTKRIEVE